ncbi:unnamed protein product [Linum trigynum]|uniref:Uncharacterized protein n=1 Tax=Linum trigynum TaxID=586398 RepID=A0AAV2DN42_9ROSI
MRPSGNVPPHNDTLIEYISPLCDTPLTGMLLPLRLKEKRLPTGPKEKCLPTGSHISQQARRGDAFREA